MRDLEKTTRTDKDAMVESTRELQQAGQLIACASAAYFEFWTCSICP